MLARRWLQRWCNAGVVLVHCWCTAGETLV
jgi:hypothetical protein